MTTASVGNSLARAVIVALVAMAVALGAVAGGTGCARHRPAERQPREPRPDKFIETVRARAPFDLSCSGEQITIVQLGQTALGAEGCGRRTSYSCLCTFHVWFTCTQALCALDGAATTSPGPSPGSPPPSPQSPDGTPLPTAPT